MKCVKTFLLVVLMAFFIDSVTFADNNAQGNDDSAFNAKSIKGDQIKAKASAEKDKKAFKHAKKTNAKIKANAKKAKKKAKNAKVAAPKEAPKVEAPVEDAPPVIEGDDAPPPSDDEFPAEE